MILDESREQEYLKWYQVAREALPNLIPTLTDDEIKEHISMKDWLIFPLPTEEGKLQAVNRPDPHIDITLRDPGKIRIGIRCNTVKSVEKLKNILESHHLKEKTQLIQQMRSLDDGYHTQIISKKKEYNLAQAPKHETLFDAKSNTIEEAKIEQIFNLVDEIRKRGIDKKSEQGLGFLPEAPVIDLVVVSLPLDEEAFRSALAKIGPIFEICRRVKTRSEINFKRKRAEKVKTKARFEGYICHNCQTKFPMDGKPRFCPNCGTYISNLY
ncbi:hypothetical protein KEJ21_01555 [Candidatus Bathyarchaeota archaeon]|nr:hypothetical protein [Candidatus Bathyarchaeota archaeon]MBS7630870.1 hypothetical protein [Candidatus Bathyarchaeota archaeon]